MDMVIMVVALLALQMATSGFGHSMFCTMCSLH